MLPDVTDEVVYEEATVADLLRRIKDGRPLLRRLFEIYQEETPRLLEELEQALAARDSEGAYDALHQMKGSASAMGARKVFRITERALSLCGNGDILKVEDVIERIRCESDRFMHGISAVLAEH